MPAITVGLPAALTAPEPPRDIACEAATVGEALLAVVEQAPRFEKRIFYENRLLVVVTLNGRHLPPTEAQQMAGLYLPLSCLQQRSAAQRLQGRFLKGLH